MEAEAQVGAADHARIFLRFKPAGAKLDPARRQTRESPLELQAPVVLLHEVGDELQQARPALAAQLDVGMEPSDPQLITRPLFTERSRTQPG